MANVYVCMFSCFVYVCMFSLSITASPHIPLWPVNTMQCCWFGPPKCFHCCGTTPGGWSCTFAGMEVAGALSDGEGSGRPRARPEGQHTKCETRTSAHPDWGAEGMEQHEAGSHGVEATHAACHHAGSQLCLGMAEMAFRTQRRGMLKVQGHLCFVGGWSHCAFHLQILLEHLLGFWHLRSEITAYGHRRSNGLSNRTCPNHHQYLIKHHHAYNRC